jgi:hypothetical protein
MSAAQSTDFQTSRGSPRITREELPRLGLPEARVFAVPENTLIVADTMGFHARGLSPRPATRVEIWAYGRRNPFVPWLGYDPTALPLIKGRAAPLYWSLLDWSERLRLARNPWRFVGIRPPLEAPSP